LLYKGKLNNYQLEGNKFNDKKVSKIEQGPYNEYQNLLYNRVLYGLSVFSKEELQVMHWEKKKRITKVNLRTKAILNIWKQEITNKLFDKFFKPKFINSKSEFGKEFINLYSNETDSEIEIKIPFKTLGIFKKDIITKLIVESLLPKNFYELKPVYYGLPRLLIKS